MRLNEHGLNRWCGSCQGQPRPEGDPPCAPCRVKRQQHGLSWPREDFDEWSELTKERDGYRADAEAERHRL
jgi:hypothetical protein